MPLLRCGALPAALLLATAGTLHGVIYRATADTAYHTAAPAGSLAGSGWQWTGLWGPYQGVPIGPHHFITAKHIGGAVGQTFTLNAAGYATTRAFDDPSSDLRIWEVRDAFPDWAPLYRTGNETGKTLVVFGRGLTRGAEVRDAATNTLRGWQWGGSPGTLRWGQNTVAATPTTAYGPQLYATFDTSGGADECHLANGDSSGPVFIKDGAAWKIAGVASSVDAYFNTANTGSGFFAAIFDGRGLYYGSSGNWQLIGGATPAASGFYATRVSSRAAWIDSVLAEPLTATVTLGSLAQTYDGTPRSVSVTTDPAGLACSVTYEGSPSAPVGAGAYAVAATVTESGYTGSATETLTIAKAAQSLTFPSIPDRSLEQSPFAPPASASSGLPVSLAVISGPANIGGGTVTLTGTGTVVLRATQDGDNNHSPAAPVDQSFAVTAPVAAAAQAVPATPAWAVAAAAIVLIRVALRRRSTG